MRKVSDAITGSDTFPVKSGRTMASNASMNCCRSEKHVGHLQRANEVARRMSEWFDVTILVLSSDGRPLAR